MVSRHNITFALEAQNQLAAAAHDRWFCEQIKVGLGQAEGGQLVPHEEVMSDSREQRERIRARIARTSK